MDFLTYLKQSAEEIEKLTVSFKKDWDQEIAIVSPKLSPLTDIFTNAWEGGKRLRGTLVKLGYEIVTGQNNPEVLKAAVAYEIFQTSILAHDDIIDLSPTRRGKPTLYRQLGGDHYAISQTICLGDIGFFLSVRLISNSDFEPDIKNQAVNAFTRMVINTGLGEMLDIELSHPPFSRLEKDVLTIHRLKTAYYTIVDPMEIGAILAGANPKLLKSIEVFGENLGIAFQIQDDILGVFGDEKTLGKSVTSDIEEGKNTLLITYALEHSDKAQLAILSKYYGQGKIGQKELNLIKKVFEDSSSLDYSRKKALKYVKTAKKVIPQMTKNPEHIKILEQMADFLVQRDK